MSVLILRKKQELRSARNKQDGLSKNDGLKNDILKYM